MRPFAIARICAMLNRPCLACPRPRWRVDQRTRRSLSVAEASKPWDGTIVRTWLEKRIVAARADQVAAERAGRGHQDDCDKADAQDMICPALKGKVATTAQQALVEELRNLLDREQYSWRGIYDDHRFDRHARSYIRKLLKMTRENTGFEQTRHYQ